MATTLRDNVTAATRADVDAQDTRTRLWESLSNSYDQQAKQIQQAYDRSYSQTGNQLLNRGMGRSSYGSQVLANVNQEGINAQIQNHNNLIADYQNRLQEIEQQEIAKDQWERSFGLQQQQFDWEKQSSQQQIAMSYISAIAAQGGTPTDDLLAQAGLSRQDYNAMRQQLAAGNVATTGSSGGSRGGSSRGGSNNNNNNNNNNANTTLGDLTSNISDWLAANGKGVNIGTLKNNLPTYTVNASQTPATRGYDTAKAKTSVTGGLTKDLLKLKEDSSIISGMSKR